MMKMIHPVAGALGLAMILSFWLSTLLSELFADAATVTDLESKSDSWCFMQHWMGNDQVGFGYNNNHDLLFHAPVSDNTMSVLVNGTPYTLALTPVTE